MNFISPSVPISLFPLPPLLSHASSWPPLVLPALSSSLLSLSSVTKVPRGRTGSHQTRGEAGAAGSAAFSAKWERMSLKSQTARAHQFQPQCLVSPLSVGFGWTSLCTCSRKGHQRCSPPRGSSLSAGSIWGSPKPKYPNWAQRTSRCPPLPLHRWLSWRPPPRAHRKGSCTTQHGPWPPVLAPGQSRPVWPSDKHGHTRRCSLVWCHGAQSQENGDERQHHSTETSHAVQTPHSPPPTEEEKDCFLYIPIISFIFYNYSFIIALHICLFTFLAPYFFFNNICIAVLYLMMMIMIINIEFLSFFLHFFFLILINMFISLFMYWFHLIYLCSILLLLVYFH